LKSPSEALAEALEALNREVVSCRRCPRLVEYREKIATEKKRAFQDYEYWGKPVPGFGDPDAQLLMLGLAPAAHGSNRTGRMFTGDGERGAGDFLMRALHRAGYANIPYARDRNDGLKLTDAYLTAQLRCAPPLNKPTASEITNCAQFLEREVELLENVKVVVAFGKIAFDGYLSFLVSQGNEIPKPKPKFSHGAVLEVEDYPVLIGSYHPSRQNTQTGKLTERMFDEIFELAGRVIQTA